MNQDDWPLKRDREFESEFFTEEELTAMQQENCWLKNRDAEDGIYTQYPTYDYSYVYYECKTIDELRQAFLYGNWAIRQCFTYRNLAFINQVNAGDEWWALKKLEDGTLISFESITMIAIINHLKEESDLHHYGCPDCGWKTTTRAWRVRCSDCGSLNLERRLKNGGWWKADRAAPDYFEGYINQLLKATEEQCYSLNYTDEEFNRQYKVNYYGTHVHRVNSSSELREASTSQRKTSYP